MSPDPISDQDLFVALQRGDDLALNQLISRWEKPLFAFAWRYVQNTADARDLVAETFVRLYQQRLRLRTDTKVSAWLFTALTNLCHNQYRWRHRHPTVSFHSQEEDGSSLSDRLSGDAPRVNENVERDEALHQLMKAVDELPHELKTTVLLHHYEGLTYQQIGAITGCSPRGVETRLYRAKQRLRERLTEFVKEITHGR